MNCYDTRQNAGKGGLAQTGHLHEGDLIVRKVIDEDNDKECLISYVSTEGTSPFIYCFDKGKVAKPVSKSSGTAPPSSPGESTTTWMPNLYGK